MRPVSLRTLAAAALTAVLAVSSTARAGDFVDLRLSFNFVDENVLVAPGETVPSIPGPRIGAPIPRWGLFFFDNYDSRFTGFENLTDMILYKNYKQGNDEYEGAFILYFNTSTDNLANIYDGGSYLKWTHWIDPTPGNRSSVSFTAYPMSSDMFRLGFSYKISWGGSPIFFKSTQDNPIVGAANVTPAPGAKLQWTNERGYAYVGAKTSLLLNQAINEQETIYGFLAGAGIDATQWLRLEANGGYFYRGVNPIQEVLGKPVQTYGISGQWTIHQGVPVGRSQDFAFFKNDPSTVGRMFTPEEYPGGTSWLLSMEGTYTGTTLQSADPTQAESIVVQPAGAADLNFRMKIRFWRIHADLVYSDLSYSLLNVPSFVPFQALDAALAKTTPMIFFAAGFDRFLPNQSLTLGATVGVEMPATFQGVLPPSFVNDLPSDAIPQSATVIVRSQGLFDILPPGYAVDPVFASKLTAMFQHGGFDVLAELLIGYDNNVTHLARINDDPEEVLTRVFNNPWQLGFNIAFQARM